MGKTSIGWTRGDDGSLGETWNPVTGCTKVSAGCKHCYAERVFPRAYAKSGRRFIDVATHPDRLEQPLRWRKPRRVFVNSMSDLFHEDIPEEFIDRVWRVMTKARQHTFQILTKRPERMLAYLSRFRPDGDGWMTRDGRPAMGELQSGPLTSTPHWPSKHIWLGVSVEDQETANERIPLLLQTPAALRFVSYEPALEPVRWDFSWLPHGSVDSMFPRLDWIIVGGESGPGARPFDIAWARETLLQCRKAGIACFVKQLGARPIAAKMELLAAGWAVEPDYPPCFRLDLRDRKGENPAEWPADLRVQEFPR